MTGRVLMIQGTSSSAGKSLLVAALCRIFARRGVRVAPFKAQNMSNNAAVCADGGEIGRSQALQAAAAGIASSVDMNPILLKPEADARSQVIVNGRPWRTLGAKDYFRTKGTLWPVVTGALDRLRSAYELVVIEGAGSPAEMNLREVEIVNMAVARYCQAPVLLVGDIERGGVFAQLLGTLWLLSDDERALVRGLLINKFRGDVSLFDGGRSFLEQRGGVPVLGVIPWVSGLNLPEEDAEVLCRTSSSQLKKGSDPLESPERVRPLFQLAATLESQGHLDIVVIRLPRISNFDDFAPLAAEPGVRLRYVDAVSQLGRPDAVILPGTKSTMSDLEWLRQSGLAPRIVALSRQGIQVVGICGGYQMLGQSLGDPELVESNHVEMPGLGLLPTETLFAQRKETCQVRGVVLDHRHSPGECGQILEGYEIHAGRTSGGKPWLELTRPGDTSASVKDGAVSDDGVVWGCYLHGLFGNDEFRRRWLKSLGHHSESNLPAGPTYDRQEPKGRNGLKGDFAGDDGCDGASLIHSFADDVDGSLNRLADHVEEALDYERLAQIVWNPVGASQ